MKKFAPLAVLFGLLTALLLGGTASALAATPDSGHGSFTCNNVAGVTVVQCSDVLDNVKVTINGNRVLTNNELNILSGDLNNTQLDVQDIDVTVINAYKSFNPPINITVQDINVCIASVCS